MRVDVLHIYVFTPRSTIAGYARFLIAGDNDRVSAAIMRIANGNFRALHRIFDEMQRLQRLNRVAIITSELVEMARQDLLLSPS